MSPWQIMKCDDSQNDADIAPASVALKGEGRWGGGDLSFLLAVHRHIEHAAEETGTHTYTHTKGTFTSKTIHINVTQANNPHQ